MLVSLQTHITNNRWGRCQTLLWVLLHTTSCFSY